MSSNIKTNKIKKKSKTEKETKQTESVLPQEAITAELEKYLKITEGEIKNQQEKEEITKKIKKIYDDKIEEVKQLKSEDKLEDLYNIQLIQHKSGLDLELKSLKLKLECQIFSKEIKIYEEQNVSLNKKLVEYEKYNKALLEKVKDITDEKNNIQKEELEKFETIKGKCDDFKQDVISKFEVTDTDIIRKENETLREKLTEYKDHSKMIEDSIKAQMDFKEKQLNLIEDGLTSQLNPKLNEFDEQNDKLKKENDELKEEFNSNLERINNLQDSITKFHSNFEIGKKEFEKKAQELFKLTKENRELKSFDPTNLQNELQNKKSQLEVIITENKQLTEKIAKLKQLLK